MAFITLNTKKLKSNYDYLDHLFKQNGIQWSVVSKMLCGNKKYLEILLNMGIKQVCDSRISNLKTIKSINPHVETVFIKPPAKRSVSKVVEYADISLNTSFETIQLLSEAAMNANKTHRIIIMVEMGELREGVLRDDLVDFYSKVFHLPNIEVIGIGTNLTCMYGVLPSHDKLIQLSLYKQLIEAKFNRKIPFISGGASVTIPLIKKHMLPKGINHFRVGETLFLGTDVYHDTVFRHMNNDVFKLYAEIIELYEKPNTPSGEMGSNLEGEKIDFNNRHYNTSYRAIVDVGLLDVEANHIMPVKNNMQIAGASSDMIVIDLGDNEDNLKTGDLIEFRMDYMGVLRLMNSDYVEKKIENEHHLNGKEPSHRTIPSILN